MTTPAQERLAAQERKAAIGIAWVNVTTKGDAFARCRHCPAQKLISGATRALFDAAYQAFVELHTATCGNPPMPCDPGCRCERAETRRKNAQKRAERTARYSA